MSVGVDYDLINWLTEITEPPILKKVSYELLESFFNQGEENRIAFLLLSCHTQAVERAVKTVIEAAGVLGSKSAREGFIKTQTEPRKLMSKF
ncbi:unnamed protein product [Parnassius apollo]|uniref:(apollo) hypothetical protein n=1 Tax=Parnassius apollo TaxID=110799 RepID=A0A8S3WVF9_PARAO|nr:unnamed protein product [Parnassius apollo]